MWAGPVDAVTSELSAPTLGPDDLHDPTIPAAVVAHWGELARQVATAVGTGGAELTGDQAGYVRAVVRRLGTHYGELNHTSAGGPESRDRFLAGPVSQRFGPTFAAAIVNRPLAGLTWADYPMIGWATADELTTALAIAANADADRPEDLEPLHTLHRTIRRAARFGVDIITIYG